MKNLRSGLLHAKKYVDPFLLGASKNVSCVEWTVYISTPTWGKLSSNDESSSLYAENLSIQNYPNIQTTWLQKSARYKTKKNRPQSPTNQPTNQLNMMMTILVMLKVLMSDVPTIQTTTWHIMNHRRAKDHALITYGWVVLLGSWQWAHHTQPERCKVQIFKSMRSGWFQVISSDFLMSCGREFYQLQPNLNC